MNQDTATKRVPLQDLGDGLILRRATVADTEALAAFNAEVFRDTETKELNKYVYAWTQDLMRGDHPTFDPGDFIVVEDTRTGALVSSLNLISQTWSYGGSRITVGRPELVGTHPNYRRRGLVRALFEIIHQLSAERGEKLQAITGIPWYYRQFGYEMALELGGGRTGYPPHIPKLKDGETEPYRIRPATEDDLQFITELYEQAMKRYLVACIRDERLWRYELQGRSAQSSERWEFRIIETPDGESIGFLVHPPRLFGPTLGVSFYELKEGTSWLAATPSVLRYLQATGEMYAAERKKEPFGAFAFWLGSEHPVYEAIHTRLPRTHKPYAWYIRVPDLLDFLRHITTVLEQRLANSVAGRYTGDLKISFYRDGLRLVFEQGRLTGVEQWMPTPDQAGTAAFPDRTFLQLVFGYRSLEELEYAFPDCWTGTDEARALLQALFPKQASLVWPVA